MTQENRVLYWALTLFFAVLLGASGITYLMAIPVNVEGFVHLGYPLYLMKFLGAAKVLGALAIVSGRYPTLKEWAYAGFTFDLLGAFYSHLSLGDGWKALYPLGMLAVMFFSYVEWKKAVAERG